MICILYHFIANSDAIINIPSQHLHPEENLPAVQMTPKNLQSEWSEILLALLRVILVTENAKKIM